MEKLTSSQQAMLTSHPCFTAASDENQQGIYKSAYIKALNKGEFLQRRGDTATGYYGVYSGRIKAYSMNTDGKSLTLKYLQAGDWFGEISLLDGIARTHDCEVIEPCQIIIIPKAAFEQFVMNDLQAMKAMAKQLCQRIRTSMNLIEQMSIQPLSERLAVRLLELYQASGNPLNVNQQDIAHMLGVSRQSTSKILTQWAEQGLIKLEYHQIELLQPSSLESLCSPLSVPLN